MSSSAPNLKVITNRANPKRKAPDYVPSAMEIRNDRLVKDIRHARKSLRQESIRLRKTALGVLLLSVVSMALWVFFATYARAVLGIGTMIILGLVGVACVVGTMAIAGVLTAIAYSLEDESKKLSKEV